MHRKFALLSAWSAALILAITTLAVNPVIGSEQQIKLTSGTYSAKWSIPDPNAVDIAGIPDGILDFDYPVSDSAKAGLKLNSARAKFGRMLFSSDPVDQGISTRLPDDAASRPIFAYDESQGAGTGYDTLYVDLNGSGTLADDPAMHPIVTPTSDTDQQMAVDAPKHFRLPGTYTCKRFFEGSTDEKPIAVDIYIQSNDAQCVGMILCRGNWFGELDTSEGKVPFALIDGSKDGRYEDGWNPKTDSKIQDKVALDFGNGTDGYRWMAWGLCLTSGIEFQGGFYDLKASDSGDQLTVAPYTGPFGTVVLKPAAKGIPNFGIDQAVLDRNGCKYPIFSDGKAVVPTGNYRFSFACLSAKQDNRVYIMSYFPSRRVLLTENRTMTIAVYGKPRLSIGNGKSPLIYTKGKESRIQVQLLLPTGDKVDGIRWKVTDHTGAVSSSGQSSPVLLLKNTRGTTVLKQSADQWWGGQGIGLVVPKYVRPGRYVVEVRYDAGPFGGILKATRPAVVK